MVMVEWCRLISFVIFIVYPLLDIRKFGSRKISFLCNLLLKNIRTFFGCNNPSFL